MEILIGAQQDSQLWLAGGGHGKGGFGKGGFGKGGFGKGGQGYGGYGAGGFVTGTGPIITGSYVGGPYVARPLVAASYSTGAYAQPGLNGYSALALQSSSAGAVVAGYNSYNVGAYAPAPVLPSLPAIGHLESPVENVETFVSTDGPLLENNVNSYSRKKTVAITHKPVYHKTIHNHYTQHDRVHKDVLHHVGETENRHFNVAGREVSGGAINIQHGNTGHAAYPSIVGVSSSSAVAPTTTSTAFEPNLRTYGQPTAFEYRQPAAFQRPGLPLLG